MLKFKTRTQWHRRAIGAIAATVVIAASSFTPLAAPAAAQSDSQSDQPPQQQPKPQTGGLSVGPAQSPGGVKRSSFDFVVSAGAVQDDAVTVANLTNDPKTYFVYVADAFTTDTGKIGTLSNDAPKKGAATWLKFGQDFPDGQIRLEPHTAALIPFRINVPADASPGDYAFGIAAVPPAIRPQPQKGENRTAVVNAVAVAVQLRVQGPLHPSVRITSLAVSADPPLIPYLVTGETDVEVEVVNDGNQRLPTTVHISEKNFWGRTIHTEPDRTLPTLLPGSKVKIHAHWHKAPMVKGSIVVLVTTEGAGGAAATRTRDFWSIPWKLIIALVVLGVFAYWYWRKWRQRRRPAEVAPPEPDPEPEPVTVASS